MSSPQHPEAFEVIRRVAAEKNAVFYSVDKDSLREKLYASMEKQVFDLATKYVEYPRLEISLLGDFQAENASAAVLAADGLRHYGIFIDKRVVSEGLRDARWPGRFEILRKRPLVVVDGAQNGQSAFTLKMSVKDNLRYKKLFLVIGVMRDKDIDGICGELSQIADYVITTRAESGRACPPGLLRDKMLRYKKMEAVETVSVKEALNKALAAAGADDAILITGSLYVVGEAMEILAK